jgi:hypothetical protein
MFLGRERQVNIERVRDKDRKSEIENELIRKEVFVNLKNKEELKIFKKNIIQLKRKRLKMVIIL